MTLDNPGAAVPDGDGGFTYPLTPLSPATAWAEIKPATSRDLERVTADTVLSTASHVITMDYHAGVTTKTRITFEGRVFNVTGVSDPEERHIDTIAVCVEVVA